MLNIAIVDDEQVHRDILVRYIEEWKERERCEAEAETFASGEAFYFAWCGQQRYDVLFLDIMMGGRHQPCEAAQGAGKGFDYHIHHRNRRLHAGGL
ncbi:hypothetical protein [uncultured Acetatifactor sp.]|uniref:hypothetical protein n=1 Tax=uncultured Acetatifactor sp. TaxID=1671927 RepID=UPI0026112113|nr:hypothetical protein [uncultured Acetatifactor sp.]